MKNKFLSIGLISGSILPSLVNAEALNLTSDVDLYGASLNVNGKHSIRVSNLTYGGALYDATITLNMDGTWTVSDTRSPVTVESAGKWKMLKILDSNCDFPPYSATNIAAIESNVFIELNGEEMKVLYDSEGGNIALEGTYSENTMQYVGNSNTGFIPNDFGSQLTNTSQAGALIFHGDGTFSGAGTMVTKIPGQPTCYGTVSYTGIKLLE